MWKAIKSLPITLEIMTIKGDEQYGYCAKYTNDPNSIWAAKKETAIFGCKQRRNEVVSGKLIRGNWAFYSS